MLRRSTSFAEPVNSADPTSAWLTAPRPALRALRKVIGQSAYVGHAGAYSGGANAVYWLEVIRHNADGTLHLRNITEGAKREVAPQTVDLEEDFLFPLLRERDVKRWRLGADPNARFLIV